MTPPSYRPNMKKCPKKDPRALGFLIIQTNFAALPGNTLPDIFFHLQIISFQIPFNVYPKMPIKSTNRTLGAQTSYLGVPQAILIPRSHSLCFLNSKATTNCI